MKLALKLKEDILELIEILYRQKADEGDPWSDTKLSTMCFKYGDFVPALRRWTDGKGGPTLAKVQELEQFIREQIGEEKYNQFLATRVPSKDDFDN